jgi:hypothetical protein
MLIGDLPMTREKDKFQRLRNLPNPINPYFTIPGLQLAFHSLCLYGIPYTATLLENNLKHIWWLLDDISLDYMCLRSQIPNACNEALLYDPERFPSHSCLHVNIMSFVSLVMLSLSTFLLSPLDRHSNRHLRISRRSYPHREIVLNARCHRGHKLL